MATKVMPAIVRPIATTIIISSSENPRCRFEVIKVFPGMRCRIPETSSRQRQKWGGPLLLAKHRAGASFIASLFILETGRTPVKARRVNVLALTFRDTRWLLRSLIETERLNLARSLGSRCGHDSGNLVRGT